MQERAAFRTEREWLVPSIALTVLLGGSALLVMPDYSGVGGALSLLPMWLAAAVTLAGIYALPALWNMMRAGVTSPTARILALARKNWRSILLVCAGMVIAGLNMITFMYSKPLLNYLVPFWADPLLADVDYYLFLGHDPFSLLSWLNSVGMALFYHRAWFALMVMTLLMVLTRPASVERSSILVSYFVLWSVAGPIIHLLLPAAGPVFFENLGYGDRFAGLQVPEEMTEMSDFLWTVYSGSQFAPGSGISAMPSMHIATTAWMLIAVHVLARRWSAPMAAVGLLIFLLSISLGWHYAADGIVGAAAAVACYLAAKRVYGRERSAGDVPALGGVQAA
jgi:hypothetical protein